MNSQELNDKLTIEVENLRIYVVLYGGFFYQSSEQSPTHSHNRYEFHLTIDGCTNLSTNSKEFSLNSSQACIVAPHVIHTCRPIREKTVKTSFGFSFEKINKKTKNDIYSIFSKAFCNIEDVRKIDYANKYIPDLNRIMSVFYSRESFALIKLKMYFSLFMFNLADDLLPENEHELSQLNTEPRIEKTDKNIRRIMIEDYINHNYGKEISLESLSKTLYLSKKQTERIFAQEIGMSFKSFVLKIRLEAAIYYLCNTQIPVAEISSKVGYKSYNGFYRLFFSHTNMTPLEYRKKYSHQRNTVNEEI